MKRGNAVGKVSHSLHRKGNVFRGGETQVNSSEQRQHLLSLLYYKSFFFFFLKIYLLFLYFWLRRVLAAAHGIFVEACGLFVAVHGLLFSCGVRFFSSLVVTRRLQGTWAL